MAILEFPKDFLWGTATAAFQVEGATEEDGRGTSIWDTFCRIPGKVYQGDNGDVACGMYYTYPEDIRMMAEMGIKSYRFSIAWPRVIQGGSGAINYPGLDYYHDLVDELIKYGIEPNCTLYHWDLPQALQEQGGWENRETIRHFVRYADIVFQSLGSKIKRWATFNEPWCVSFMAHYYGRHAPGKTSLQTGIDVAHHVLVAHGLTVRRFRERGLQGEIGIVVNTEWAEPYSDQPEDVEAAWRQRGFLNEWFVRPLLKGNYPDKLVEWFGRTGATIPIEAGDMESISEPIDFLGINYYSGSVGRYKEGASLFDYEAIDIGWSKTDIGWNIYPQGLYHVLKYMKDEFGDIPLYITENGACYNDEPGPDGKVRDGRREYYLAAHITQVHRAIESGVNLKGYYCWSLLDNFEWAYGYSKRFGLVHVDYETQKRTVKESGKWFSRLVRLNWLELL
jgi:beta-glucosidase